MVNNPLAYIGDTSLIPGLARSLQKEMATHSSILPWEIPWTEEPGGATVHRVAKSWERLSTSGGKAARQQCA